MNEVGTIRGFCRNPISDPAQAIQHNFCHRFFGDRARSTFLGPTAIMASECLSSDLHLYFLVRFRRPRLCSMSPFLSSATRIAASNTSFRFFWVKAEHSIYTSAPISCAFSMASLSVTGRSLYFASSISSLTSLRRSHCVPTRRMVGWGQCALISGSHFSERLWKDVGETTL